MTEADQWELLQDQDFEDGVLKALGWMVIQSDMFEHALADLYRLGSGKEWEAAREDLRGKTLGPILDLAVGAFAQRFPTGEFHERLEALKPDLQRAVDTRNQFLHASWSFDHYKRVMHRSRHPRGAPGVREYLLFSVADLQSASDLVGDMAERIYDELFDPAAAHLRR